ncbi:PTS lactose/cellobiose transporter subunit IIA [Enterococcus casseliflavus]|uniref:PTS lactose/cellobiose transporter subunit IIA n=1 Tax=Enterococcus casseliflavus TaxID=37734 RepID=UPI00232C57B2|nr:PTS lactose/cellobiose transporter subunit IIA [Enterococcus casseliflavus]MDB1694658.1 PTS lactose/cellobiose transporter subunit IIA [Enterococcus casseliflavus]MDB1698092.1 PTS lactose/cellobiose transporter subunit IIA [Enterococcus casseliflavus]MDB1703071.1 PTS lactose/cellobiose transporter subunit IIA [Enterococcus casseliflavus]MDB1704045.1 PTS lactose/cellobiose transporter subunit IIA [Enterococcus casseliflavus]
MEEQYENELIPIAMQIIIHAGDARNLLVDAMKMAKTFDFSAAEKKLFEAEKKIVLAHKAQTEVIQKEANGHYYEIFFLFVHAQDTLMTINSEVKMTKEMIDILRIVERGQKE